METRKAWLERKRVQIQKQLVRSAKKEVRLGPDEHISFAIGIYRRPFVTGMIIEDDYFLRMRAREYFTSDRFRGVGIYVTDILLRLHKIWEYLEAEKQSPMTVGDMVAMGRKELLKRKLIGQKILGRMEKVLNNDGIMLRP